MDDFTAVFLNRQEVSGDFSHKIFSRKFVFFSSLLKLQNLQTVRALMFSDTH